MKASAHLILCTRKISDLSFLLEDLSWLVTPTNFVSFPTKRSVIFGVLSFTYKNLYRLLFSGLLLGRFEFSTAAFYLLMILFLYEVPVQCM